MRRRNTEVGKTNTVREEQTELNVLGTVRRQAGPVGFPRYTAIKSFSADNVSNY